MNAARPTTGSASDQGRRRHNADALAVVARGGGLGVAVADGIGDTADAVAAAHLAANAAARAAVGGNAVAAVPAARAALLAGGGGTGGGAADESGAAAEGGPAGGMSADAAGVGSGAGRGIAGRRSVFRLATPFGTRRQVGRAARGVGSRPVGDAVLVVAALRPGQGEVAWVGDCRAYLYDGARVRRLTADQTAAEAAHDTGGTPAPSWEHAVRQSVRTASPEAIGRADVPDVFGRLALVTDGVHRDLAEAEIAAVLSSAADAASAARELTDLALLAGGGDNASATVIEVPLVPALPAERTDTGPTFPAVPAESA